MLKVYDGEDDTTGEIVYRSDGTGAAESPKTVIITSGHFYILTRSRFGRMSVMCGNISSGLTNVSGGSYHGSEAVAYIKGDITSSTITTGSMTAYLDYDN